MTGEWITADDFDADAIDTDLFSIDWSDVPTVWDRIEYDELVGFGAMDTIARREERRIERAIRGAIRAGYDGVDINYEPPGGSSLAREPLSESFDVGPVSIEPWHRPAPDGANGYRTERYTWDWFSEDDLTALLRADDPTEVLHKDD